MCGSLSPIRSCPHMWVKILTCKTCAYYGRPMIHGSFLATSWASKVISSLIFPRPKGWKLVELSYLGFLWLGPMAFGSILLIFRAYLLDRSWAQVGLETVWTKSNFYYGVGATRIQVGIWFPLLCCFYMHASYYLTCAYVCAGYSRAHKHCLP